MNKVFRVMLITFCFMFLSACNSKEVYIAEVPNELPEFEPLNNIKEGRPNIFLIVRLMDSDYWDVVVNGVRKAADEYGCNAYYSGTYNETDWEGQHELIKKAVDMGADGFIVAPNDAIKLTSDFSALKEKNIPLALVDSVVNEDVFDVCYMTDNYIAGRNAAEEMLLQLHENGHQNGDLVEVGVLVGSDTSQTINERLAGFYQYWSENAPDNWSIINDIMNCNGDIEYAKELTKKILVNNQNLSGLYGTNNGPTKALCSTVMEGDYKNVIVVGFDYSDEMKKMIESDNYVASTMLQRQYDMGYCAMKTISFLLAGGKIKNAFDDTGVVVVKKETLSNNEIVEILNQN